MIKQIKQAEALVGESGDPTLCNTIIHTLSNTWLNDRVCHRKTLAIRTMAF